MAINRCEGKDQALEAYVFSGPVKSCKPYGSGHINDTFLVVCPGENFAGVKREKRYILQRMNKDIFTKPVELMENIQRVTSYLSGVIRKNGGDPARETLTVVHTRQSNPFFLDSFGEYWRIYDFIEGSISYDQVEKPEDFYESAVSFGNFQRLLADFPAASLHETIPHFHDTAIRFQTFRQAVQVDKFHRASQVQEEIQFVLDRETTCFVLGDLLKRGEMPLRVTHNDTKLNNIMMDARTGKGICVIDLDTVMPGLSVHDFGDSIRFGANTGAEDEQDLSKISLDLALFELYTKGFLVGCAGRLTQKEINALPMGAKAMTLECGMRFLTDYLQGDTYFKTHRPGHNLDRCRTQFALVADMERKWDQMAAIVKEQQ